MNTSGTVSEMNEENVSGTVHCLDIIVRVMLDNVECKIEEAYDALNDKGTEGASEIAQLYEEIADELTEVASRLEEESLYLYRLNAEKDEDAD